MRLTTVRPYRRHRARGRDALITLIVALAGCGAEPTVPDDPDPMVETVATMVMSADIDGVQTDLSWEGAFEIDLEESTRDGSLSIEGFSGPDGTSLSPTCATCALLSIDLFHELGVALTTGTYPVETFGPTGLRAEGTFTPSVADASTVFGTNDSDPTSQPWSGQLVLQTLSGDVAAGTFELLLYDAGGAGPPYPVVTITNGSFRLSIE